MPEEFYTRINKADLLEYQRKAKLYDELKDTINAHEFMVLVELFSSAFDILPFEGLEKITSTKLFTIKDEDTNTGVLAIMLSRFDRYATYIGFPIDENGELIENSNAYTFYIMPNEDFTSDTCDVKELNNTQTSAIKAAAGEDRLKEYAKYIKDNEKENDDED